MATISLLILHPSHIWTLLLTRKKEKKATKTTQDGKRSSANLIRLKVSVFSLCTLVLCVIMGFLQFF
ncbi:unnamed protein product [Prunus armeniaca]